MKPPSRAKNQVYGHLVGLDCQRQGFPKAAVACKRLIGKLALGRMSTIERVRFHFVSHAQRDRWFSPWPVAEEA